MRISNQPLCFILTFLVLSGVGSICSESSGADDIDDLLPVLVAGIEQWGRDVQFYCTFDYRSASVLTAEQALSGEWQATTSATGLYVKRGPDYRFRIDFGGPAIDVTPEGHPGAVTTNSSLEKLLVGDLFARYALEFGRQQDHIRIELWNEENAFSEPSHSAYDVGGGDDGGPLKTFFLPDDAGTILESSVERPDAEHVVLEMKRQKAGTTRTSHVKIWTAVSPPVMVRIHDIFEREDTPRYTAIYELSDFVKCQGGYMARLVRSAGGPGLSIDKEWRWFVHEWKSTDLGARNPTDEDFVVEIPAGVEFHGLKKSPPPHLPYRLDLANFDKGQLFILNFDSEHDLEQRAEAVGGNTWWVLLLIVGAIATGTFLVIARRWRFKPS